MEADGSASGPAEVGPGTGDGYLRLEGVSKRYGSVTVVENLDLTVQGGELVSLLGPSGCGKTTLLRLTAGLVRPDAGRIRVGANDLTRVPAHRRNISVVFQNYALFPHLSVRDNVAFGLRARKRERSGIARATDEALSLVRMSEFADRPVTALSGGQQQRVAVARALVVEPDLLLLDEPFSALDRKLRETMQVELKGLLRARGITAVFVTHDQDEALAVSDRIAVMNDGRIEHFAEPAELYARPATAFALSFVGLSTRLAGTVTASEENRVRIGTAYGEVVAPAGFTVGSRVIVGVRPEQISAQDEPAGHDTGAADGHCERNRLAVTLADTMALGSRSHLHGVAEGADQLLCELPGTLAGNRFRPGQRLHFAWNVEHTLIYPAPGE